MNKEKNLLLVFVKNPILGKVKTRLAASVGADKALAIYQYLMGYTANLISQLDAVEKWIYFSDFIPNSENNFTHPEFYFKLQAGEDLGKRMQNAFQEGFDAGFNRIVIIGSDCFELELEHLKQAFDELTNKAAVLGPALDGGYYLLGLARPINSLFEEKEWSTDTVLLEAIKDLNHLNVSYALLDALSDIDELDDLPEELCSRFLEK